MKIANMLILVLAIIFVASIGAIWLYPSAQDFMDGNTMWNGIHKFSNEFNVTLTDSLSSFANSSGKDALIAIPYIEYTDSELKDIKNFVNGGGTLVIMDDFGFGNSITAYLGLKARFSNSILLDPLFCYKNQNLPRITDFSGSLKDAGINSLTLNHATVITGIEDADVLASSSSYSYLDSNLNGEEDDNETRGPLTVAAAVPLGNGNIVLVSDPSIIINTMVDMNDNYAFMGYLFNRFSNGATVSLDRSHLSKSPLDTSKIKLEQFRHALNNRYVMLGAVVLLFVIITFYISKKEVSAIG
jgi:hypothetical protein